jgi:hypothetical protein
MRDICPDLPRRSSGPSIDSGPIFEQKCKEVGAPFKLIVKPGADHSYPGWPKDIAVFADWFDEQLLGGK